jgi:hypothetical protein
VYNLHEGDGLAHVSAGNVDECILSLHQEHRLVTRYDRTGGTEGEEGELGRSGTPEHINPTTYPGNAGLVKAG